MATGFNKHKEEKEQRHNHPRNIAITKSIWEHCALFAPQSIAVTISSRHSVFEW